MERFNWVKNYNKIINGEIKVNYSFSLRKLIFKNNLFEYKCNHCGIKEWNKKPITLEIEHKDGDTYNNHKSNLELLCPNCHSQTKTFRKNRKKKRKKPISEKEILEVFKNKNNINQTLLELNLSNSGGNYRRVKNILEKNNILNKEKCVINVFKPIKKETKTKLKTKRTKLSKEKLKSLILESNIDFSKQTWGVEVSKLINKTPQWSLKFVKKHLPSLIDTKKEKKPNRKEKKQLLIEEIKNSGINFQDKNWRSQLSKITGKSNWYLRNFIEDNIPSIWNNCYK